MSSDEIQARPAHLNGEPLRIETERGSEAITVTLTGELDLSSADKVGHAITNAKRSGQKVVIDLTEVRFLDSTGLQVLLRASSEDRRDGHMLSFVPSRYDAVTKLLAVTGSSELLE